MQCSAGDASFWFAVTNTHARINTGIYFDTRSGSHTDIESHADMRAQPLIQTQSNTKTTASHSPT